MEVLLHHLDLALFWTLLQSVVCKLEKDLYHLHTQEVVHVGAQCSPQAQHRRPGSRSHLVTYDSLLFHLIAQQA